MTGDKLGGWREEKQSAWLYRVVAGAEPDPRKQALFRSLAEAAESQAAVWENELARQGTPPGEFRPGLRARAVAWMIRRWGPRALLPVLAAMKVRGVSVYTAPTPAAHPMPTSVEQVGHRHMRMTAGGNLRAAVFGVNDGLVSNAGLIMGVAGAAVEPRLVLLAGTAGLLAGAFSMAAGEYVSVRSQREMYEYQIGLERDELAQYPEEEAEELALIYNARGLPMEEARRIAREIFKDPDHALDTLAREELGLNPDDLGSPWGAAAASFLAFAAGAVIPLLPFLFLTGGAVVGWSAALAGAGLMGIGMLTTLFTGRRALWGGLRMLLIGGGAGLASYWLGHWLGVRLG